MSLGEMSLTCMAPSQEYQGETGNAASMVLWMECKNLEMLLTGDVEGAGRSAAHRLDESTWKNKV